LMADITPKTTPARSAVAEKDILPMI